MCPCILEKEGEHMSLNFNFNMSQTESPTFKIDHLYDTIIIGSGPAGYNAALYAKRKGLDVGIVTKRIGGQLLNT